MLTPFVMALLLSLCFQQNVSYIPSVVKLMAAHNQTIKKEIGIHKKVWLIITKISSNLILQLVIMDSDSL